MYSESAVTASKYVNGNLSSSFLGTVVVDVWDPVTFHGEHNGYTLTVDVRSVAAGSNWTNEEAAVYYGSVVAETYR
jgi:hypothetical protein